MEGTEDGSLWPAERPGCGSCENNSSPTSIPTLLLASSSRIIQRKGINWTSIHIERVQYLEAERDALIGSVGEGWPVVRKRESVSRV